jgi:cathepsin B
VIQNNVTAIQQQIMTYGSVVAQFDVYQDFYTYSTGVYQHVSGSYLGGHAIRMIGWGVENSVPYWLCANSWGTGWGIGGLFKFRRGTNHMGIESYVVAFKA